MTTPSRHSAPAPDAMPTTKGLNFYLEDRNFQFLCESVMGPEVFERARPHLTALGEIAGGELDALAALADRNPPVLRAWDERGHRAWVDLVKAGLESVTGQAAGWAALPAAERELQARPVADTLYHLLAGSLLLAEGQLLRERGNGYRKLLAAGLYLERWLEPRGPASPPFTARQIDWLEAMAEWRPIDASALADVRS